MHRSRFSTLLVDVPRAEAARAVGFWSAALGTGAEPEPGQPQFVSLPGAFPGLVVAVQALEEGQARFHVDVETDDVAAETARLTALGAVEVSAWEGCRTLRAPGGHLLCVIPVHDPAGFAQHATTWT
ncbi:VOC family protein [Kineococcus aurantiacus]|uniref:Glyoxalase-like domain-containing protein n=1 Tax=Kineococcus aurantiacus TaxID=37633 RepID=A0A7Y9ASY6_9ACTN|nr:hypothetical protein [Kineococcus aurantiacus]